MGVALACAAAACGQQEDEGATDAAVAPMAGAEAPAVGGPPAGAGQGGSGGVPSAGGAGGMTSAPVAQDGGVPEDGGVDGGGDAPLELPSDGKALAVCRAADECDGDDLRCVVYGNFRGYCAEDCTADTDCGEIDGIAPTCESGRCVIDCAGKGEGDAACPAHMTCAEIATSPITDPMYRCQYPELKDKGVFEPCDILRGDSDCKQDLACSGFVGLPLLSEITLPYCAASCAEATACDANGSDATPVCDLTNPLALEGLCALECDNDKQCPGDMLCRAIDILQRRCGYAP